MRRPRAAAREAEQARALAVVATLLLASRLFDAIAKHHVEVQQCTRRHCVTEPQWIPVCTVCGPIPYAEACTQFREVAERETTETHRAELARDYARAVEAISPTPKGTT